MAVLFTSSKKARKPLLNDSRYQSNVFSAIKKLPDGDVVKLTGCRNQYRLRVGFLRILFMIKSDSIEIYRVEKRGDVYK